MTTVKLCITKLNNIWFISKFIPNKIKFPNFGKKIGTKDHLIVHFACERDFSVL